MLWAHLRRVHRSLHRSGSTTTSGSIAPSLTRLKSRNTREAVQRQALETWSGIFHSRLLSVQVAPEIYFAPHKKGHTVFFGLDDACPPRCRSATAASVCGIGFPRFARHAISSLAEMSLLGVSFSLICIPEVPLGARFAPLRCIPEERPGARFAPLRCLPCIPTSPAQLHNPETFLRPCFHAGFDSRFEKSDMGWDMTPSSFLWILTAFRDRYR